MPHSNSPEPSRFAVLLREGRKLFYLWGQIVNREHYQAFSILREDDFLDLTLSKT